MNDFFSRPRRARPDTVLTSSLDQAAEALFQEAIASDGIVQECRRVFDDMKHRSDETAERGEKETTGYEALDLDASGWRPPPRGIRVEGGSREAVTGPPGGERAVEPEQWLQRHPEAGSSWPRAEAVTGPPWGERGRASESLALRGWEQEALEDVF